MLVIDFKSDYEDDFGVETLALFPETCKSCHADLEINDTFTQLSCPNSFCIDKTSVRVEGMFEKLNVKDIGNSTIRSIMLTLGLSYPSEFLLYEESDFEESIPEDLKGTKQAESLKRKLRIITSQLAEKRAMTLQEYVKCLNLPNLNSRVDDLLKGYSTFEDLEEFYAKVDSIGIDFIQEQLNIKSEVSLLSIKVFETLNTYKIEVLDSLKVGLDNDLITLIQPRESEVEIILVCSDQVGGNFKTKRELYDHIDNYFGDKVGVTWKPSAVKSMSALIWQGADGSDARYTSKVKTVENWNSKGSSIPIITATQLVDIMERSSDGQTFLDTLESMYVGMED